MKESFDVLRQSPLTESVAVVLTARGVAARDAAWLVAPIMIGHVIDTHIVPAIKGHEDFELVLRSKEGTETISALAGRHGGRLLF